MALPVNSLNSGRKTRAAALRRVLHRLEEGDKTGTAVSARLPVVSSLELKGGPSPHRIPQ